jgi:predicted phosphodiesterase
MKIGLVTDIHNHAVHLRGTLEILEHEQVDQIVIIGDTFDRQVMKRYLPCPFGLNFLC